MTTTITGPHIKTALPGPKAKAIIDRDASVVSPSYTRSYPLVMERGYGAMVEDVDGNVFLDCAAGIAVNATGHAHPDVVKAVTEQATRFLHMSGTDFYYEPQVRLAEDLAAVIPIDGGVRSFFGNSGTEAIEACIKLARYATKRDNLIAFLGGFHGRTIGALSLTASKAIQRRGFGPMMPGVYHAPYADCYRWPLGVAAARADIMTWPPGAHASTFGGNPVSCAAAVATLKLLKDRLIANAADVGAHMIAGLRALIDKHPLIGDVRGRGLMIGVEL